MNCDDFKFNYTVAPNESGADMRSHLESCEVCQSFVKGHATFERQLSHVINCPVPDGFRHTLREHVINKKTFAWKLPAASVAIAASLMLALGLVNFNSGAQVSIDRLVVEHMEYEYLENALGPRHAIDSLELASVEKEFGVRINLPGQVNFAEKCPIGDSYGLHMVYEDEGQKITFIYMPEIDIKESVPFNYSGFKGWVKPVEKGSLAIVGGSTLRADYDVDKIAKSIEWL